MFDLSKCGKTIFSDTSGSYVETSSDVSHYNYLVRTNVLFCIPGCISVKLYKRMFGNFLVVRQFFPHQNTFKFSIRTSIVFSNWVSKLQFLLEFSPFRLFRSESAKLYCKISSFYDFYICIIWVKSSESYCVM